MESNRDFSLRSTQRLSLKARLIGVMLCLFFLTAFVSYLLTDWIERTALGEVQSHVETLSKAIEISVQQLPLRSQSAEDVLRDYQSRLRASGVKGITLLDANRRVVASSLGVKAGDNAPFLQTAIGTNPELYTYQLTIPVVAETRLLGFVHLNLVLDNFKVLFRNMLFYKLLGSVGVFALGIVLAVVLVSYLTKPLEELTRAARQVASGNLDIELPAPPTRDLNALVSAFRDMSARLKEQRVLEARMRENEKSVAMGQMAAGIAHDIRNPLNFMSLALDQLATRGVDNPLGSDLIRQAQTELSRVNIMVQDFLDYGREIAPRLELQPIAPILVASGEEAVRRRNQDERRVEIAGTDSLLQAPVDGELLRRAIVNLLENALDAAGPDGQVKTGICGEPESNRVIVWVEDTGPGIPAELRDQIFTPYFTTKASGVGLGLALVRKWMQSMGGDVRLNAGPGTGARFELTLPEVGPLDQSPNPQSPGVS